MSVVLSRPSMCWVCPNCTFEAVTTRSPVAPGESVTEFHHCPGLAGMWAPLVPAGTRCETVAVEREDYIAGADVQTNGDGRPIMAVITTRDDGVDAAVYAPTAHAQVG